MKKLFYVRHGKTELNAAGLIAGVTETPLTEEGREQAREAGRDAKGLGVDLIVCSPMGRTRETAELIAKQIGLPEDKIIANDLLIERNFGELEAKPYIPKETRGPLASYGAEVDEELVKRARKALDWIESLDADTILVVGHAGFGRALRSLVQEDFPMSHPHRLANAEIHQWL